MQVISRMANKKPKPLNRASFIHNSRETIYKALRMVSDGLPKEDAAKEVGVKTGTVNTWMRKFNVQQDSFLSDPELDLRLSNYNQSWLNAGKTIPEPEWQGKMPDPNYEVIVTEDTVQPTEPESLMLPEPVEGEPNLPAVIQNKQETEWYKKPEFNVLGQGLSDEETRKRAESIRFALGDKVVNDLHNTITTLVVDVSKRAKETDNILEAFHMLNIAVGIKNLGDVLDAPPLAMNWNDVSKIGNIVNKSFDFFKPPVDKTPVPPAPTKIIYTSTTSPQDPVPEAKRQINVTILAQKPPRFTKTVDAEVTEG